MFNKSEPNQPILTNDYESVIKPGVFLYKLADHYAICCSITNPKLKNTNNIRNTYACRNYRSVDSSKFRTNLQLSLLPLIYDITNSSLTSSSLDFYFNNLITTISEVIEKHAPLHTASRKQKRIQSKPWLTKGLPTSIKNKQLLYKNFFLGNNEFGKLYYKKYANKLTRVKNLAKNFIIMRQ